MKSCVKGEAALHFWEEGPLQVWPEGTAWGQDSSGSAAAPVREVGGCVLRTLETEAQTEGQQPGSTCGHPVVEIPSHYIARHRGNVENKGGAGDYIHVS